MDRLLSDEICRVSTLTAIFGTPSYYKSPACENSELMLKKPGTLSDKGLTLHLCHQHPEAQLKRVDNIVPSAKTTRSRH
jgi:hypothetical protein